MTLTLDFEGNRRAFQGEPIESMTIYDSLLAASRDRDFTVFQSGAENIVVVRLENGNEYGVLTLTLNGKTLEAALLDETVVSPGDDIVIFFSAE